MPLDIQLREARDVTLVDLAGQITLGEESRALRERLQQLLGAGKKKILINLEKVSFIDSAGVGTLVASFTSARSAGGQLKLLHLTRKIQETLQTTRLLTVFETYDDEAEAVGKFH